ncbi:hypothetical protein [Pseudonocardia sp. Ae707_Ps2]|uniref:hypothetical protein n=1 Tax=Pseudonocardia sp. Ae707_Ps2 TaxID=2212992 RepID=UPI003FD02D2D
MVLRRIWTDDGAVFDGVGHASDPGEGGHGEGGDRFDPVFVLVVAFRGPVALVSGVEQAAEVFVVVGFGSEDGVRLRRPASWVDLA